MNLRLTLRAWVAKSFEALAVASLFLARQFTSLAAWARMHAWWRW